MEINMKLIDINPHIRYAGQFTYVSKNIRVYVKDCRLFYIIDGKGKIHTGNNQLNLKPNTIFYCAGGSDYLIESEKPLLLYVFNFDLSQNHNHDRRRCRRKSHPDSVADLLLQANASNH